MRHDTHGRTKNLGSQVLRATTLAAALAGSLTATLAARADPVSEGIRRHTEILRTGSPLVLGTDEIHATETLPRFYERRLFVPAWSTSRQDARRVRELVRTLHEARSHGLRPTDYHLERLQQRIDQLRDVTAEAAAVGLRVEIDLLCTDAFLIYAAHLVSGRVNPESIDSEWTALRREVDILAVFENTIGGGSIDSALAELLPDHAGYGHLRAALRHYRGLATVGGWPTVDAGPKLESGSVDPRVAQIRQRLRQEPHPTDPMLVETASDTFDVVLDGSIRAFQERHGLEPDGIVGPATLAALNVPVQERIRQIVLNLERWRWLPQDLGRHHILVNIPAFEACVLDEGRETLQLRVIVGRSVRRTPVFSGSMTYLVLNPLWEIPHKLAVQDKLPLIKKDPEYLQKEGIHVFSGWSADAVAIDPGTVDWNALTASSFRLRLRQDAGPRNALGQVKFMFPNKHNVYLHDTPKRELFSRSERSLSSGCIRVDRPLDLAEHLLQPQWSRSRIDSALATGQTQTIALPRPYRVHLLYWTAWSDDEGHVQFRRDLYGRDTRLDRELREEPPSAEAGGPGGKS